MRRCGGRCRASQGVQRLGRSRPAFATEPGPGPGPFQPIRNASGSRQGIAVDRLGITGIAQVARRSSQPGSASGLQVIDPPRGMRSADRRPKEKPRPEARIASGQRPPAERKRRVDARGGPSKRSEDVGGRDPERRRFTSLEGKRRGSAEEGLDRDAQGPTCGLRRPIRWKSADPGGATQRTGMGLYVEQGEEGGGRRVVEGCPRIGGGRDEAAGADAAAGVLLGLLGGRRPFRRDRAAAGAATRPLRRRLRVRPFHQPAGADQRADEEFDEHQDDETDASHRRSRQTAQTAAFAASTILPRPRLVNVALSTEPSPAVTPRSIGDGSLDSVRRPP